MHNSFCNPKLLPLPFQSRWRLSFQYRCHCTYHIVLWGHLRLLDYFPSPTVNTPLLGIHATLNLCILFHILFIYLKQNQIIMYSMTISCYSQVVHSMSQSMILITKLAIELSVFKLDWDEARENLQEVTSFGLLRKVWPESFHRDIHIPAAVNNLLQIIMLTLQSAQIWQKINKCEIRVNSYKLLHRASLKHIVRRVSTLNCFEQQLYDHVWNCDCNVSILQHWVWCEHFILFLTLLTPLT